MEELRVSFAGLLLTSICIVTSFAATAFGVLWRVAGWKSGIENKIANVKSDTSRIADDVNTLKRKDYDHEKLLTKVEVLSAHVKFVGERMDSIAGKPRGGGS